MIRTTLNKLVTAYFLICTLYELNKIPSDSNFLVVLIFGAVLLAVSLVLPEK